MKRRHPNHRLVKIHRSYTVEEIATLFGVHKNTVSHWVAETSNDRLLVKMRESGERPWWWITDSGRCAGDIESGCAGLKLDVLGGG